MQFNCDAKELKAALANLKRVTGNNNKIPVLNGVLLVANADTQTVKLTGTDLEVALSVDVLANVNTPGSTVIRRADLEAAVKTAKKGNRVSITAGIPARVRSGIAESMAESWPVESFPVVPKAPLEPKNGACFDLASLQGAITKVMPFINDLESRFTMNGALLEVVRDIDGGPVSARMVATDGHRLIVQPIKLVSEIGCFRTIVSKYALAAIANMDGEFLSLETEGSHTHNCNGTRVTDADTAKYQHWRAGDSALTERVLSGHFPAYERVLPKDNPHLATIPRAELLSAVEAAIPFADERTRTGRFTLNGACDIKAGADGREFKASVAARWNGPEYFEIGFNLTYWRDALKPQSCDTVLVRLNEPGKAAELLMGDTRAIIMPVRL